MKPQEELELMYHEDDWIPPEDRSRQDDNALAMVTVMAVALDFNAIPGGEEGANHAATTIQLAWLQRAARVAARRRLAKVYLKRPLTGAGVYYENTVTGESQWERPLCATRFFPNSSW